MFLHWRRATETLDMALNPSIAVNKTPDGGIARSAVEKWLFPEPEDITIEAQEPESWPDFDPTLNDEQSVRILLQSSRLRGTTYAAS